MAAFVERLRGCSKVCARHLTRMDNVRVPLSSLTYSALAAHPAWEGTGHYTESGDELVRPVAFSEDGRVPDHYGRVWCLCVCRLADGSEHPACAWCSGNAPEGPMAWSIWTGSQDVRLILPPAPSAVLEREGPLAFCRAFGRTPNNVFPLDIMAVPRFAMSPHLRSVHVQPASISTIL